MANVIEGGPDNPAILVADAVAIGINGWLEFGAVDVSAFGFVWVEVTSSVDFQLFPRGAGAAGAGGDIFDKSGAWKTGTIGGSGNAYVFPYDVRGLTRFWCAISSQDMASAGTVSLRYLLGN